MQPSEFLKVSSQQSVLETWGNVYFLGELILLSGPHPALLKNIILQLQLHHT